MTQSHTRGEVAVDVLVLGAGAAGLMCAIEAGQRGRRTLVLDHADRAGKKILISGGGRCNFTNLNAGPENFLSANPHFAKSALSRYTPRDFLGMVERHRIPWHEKHLGQLFCDRSAQEIVTMLLRECADADARVQLNARVQSVARNGSGFLIQTNTGNIVTESLVVATGGLSIPKMGATPFGYQIARQFGIAVVDCRPGLVPFTLSGEDREIWCEFAGVSTEVVAGAVAAKSSRLVAPSFREKLLITHRGLSGPAILQISSFWSPGESILIDLAPEQAVFDELLKPNAPRLLANALEAARSKLPARWAERWVWRNVSVQGHILSNATIAELERRIHAWRIIPAGTEGYAKAEVTVGGVSTDALDARTMQARAVPGLYFIGEVVDVTGWLGGYNFQWAWASGVAAGQSA
jgi:predicted Rossmann fold flavoprotein